MTTPTFVVAFVSHTSDVVGQVPVYTVQFRVTELPGWMVSDADCWTTALMFKSESLTPTVMLSENVDVCK